jgi:hypothetical protein
MRENIFHKLVNDEDDFTELLCNMFRYKDFENIFLKYLKLDIKTKVFCETQFKTKNKQRNGRPDMVISCNNGIAFLEAKVTDSRLTKNQPEGYLKELKNKNEPTKRLYFLLPKNYKHLKELNERFDNIEHNEISINIKYWEKFFEYLKQEKFYLKSDLFNEYYNLLKNWFGYETIIFSIEEKKTMSNNINIMLKVGKWLESMRSHLETNGYSVSNSDGLLELGLYISNNIGKDYGWIGVWFELWEETGDCFIYTLSSNNDKKYFDNLSKLSDKCKLFDYHHDDTPDGKEIFKYICFDNLIFNKSIDENAIWQELSEILKNINKSKI